MRDYIQAVDSHTQIVSKLNRDFFKFSIFNLVGATNISNRFTSWGYILYIQLTQTSV